MPARSPLKASTRSRSQTPAADPRLARSLGAAFKPGFPATYLKTQTHPVFRTQRAAQRRELGRLVAVTGMTFGQATSVLRRKYDKNDLDFLPRRS